MRPKLIWVSLTIGNAGTIGLVRAGPSRGREKTPWLASGALRGRPFTNQSART